MGKTMGKSEKLDLILSELSELKSEIKKLLKQQATGTEQSVKAPSRPAPARRPKKAPKRAGAAAKVASDTAPSKPVLVQAPKTPQQAG